MSGNWLYLSQTKRVITSHPSVSITACYTIQRLTGFFSSVPSPDSALTYSSMTFHPPTGKMILYGGATLVSTFEGKVMNQTWFYHFKTNTWESIETEVSPPGIRAHAMAYSSKADKIVVFGGEIERPYSNKPINETWVFNPVTKEWQKK